MVSKLCLSAWQQHDQYLGNMKPCHMGKRCGSGGPLAWRKKDLGHIPGVTFLRDCHGEDPSLFTAPKDRVGSMGA